MANWCYTYYCVEGPAKEVFDLAYVMNGFLNSGTSRTWWHTYWLGNIRSRLDNPRKKYGYFACRGGLVTAVTENSVFDVEFSADRKVLKFVTESAWVPVHEEVYGIVQEYAPGCKIYFRTEEFWIGPVATNDFEEKYFSGDYMVFAWFNFNVPLDDTNRICRQCFGKPEYLRTWPDEYMVYISYWKEDLLNKILDRLLGRKLNANDKLPSIVDDTSGIHMYIRKIDKAQFDIKKISFFINKLKRHG